MTTSLADGIAIALAVTVIGLAIWKWRVLQDRRSILSVIRIALSDRKAVWAGTAFAAFYLAIFVIWGGRGGRIHLLFGRWIVNATPGEMFTGLVLAILLMISTALFVHGVRTMSSARSLRKGGAGFFGAALALLAAFCP